jgi:hypothetical protein
LGRGGDQGGRGEKRAEGRGGCKRREEEKGRGKEIKGDGREEKIMEKEGRAGGKRERRGGKQKRMSPEKRKGQQLAVRPTMLVYCVAWGICHSVALFLACLKPVLSHCTRQVGSSQSLH